VVFFQLYSDESEDLVHEVLLVEVRKAVYQDHYQLDEAVNEPVIEGAVVQTLVSLVVVEGQVDTGLDHHIAESE